MLKKNLHKFNFGLKKETQWVPAAAETISKPPSVFFLYQILSMLDKLCLLSENDNIQIAG